VIAYVTDVEGMWDRLATFLRGNRCAALAGDDIVLSDGAMLVFGGDAVDRGPSSRRVVGALVRAKRRYGDRVVLLAGNRDINKIRLVRELGGHPLDRVPAEARTSRPVLLRWILDNTMGARQAFELRRTELGGAPITDEAVVDSYLEEVGPGGELREYLLSAQLAYRSGATLFVHGAVGPESLGSVPGRAEKIDDLDAWIAALNAWYDDQLAAFVAGEPQGYRPLVYYQAPVPGKKVNPASVVYSRFGDELNNLILPPRETVAELRRAGIRRVLVGHTPNGDSPSILRDEDFAYVCADNSYARHPDGAKVTVDERGLTIEARSVLDGGAGVDLGFTLGGEDAPIGMRVADTGHLVKGATTAGDYVLFRYLPQFQVEQLAVSPSELAAKKLVAPY
jgi:hypothetical protein